MCVHGEITCTRGEIRRRQWFTLESFVFALVSKDSNVSRRNSRTRRGNDWHSSTLSRPHSLRNRVADSFSASNETDRRLLASTTDDL